MRRFSFTWVVLLATVCQATAAEVKISVEEPSGVGRIGWPVTSGIPFAEGALADHESSALFAPDGTEVPLQTEPLARWPDGSVRWLLLDFLVDLVADQKETLTLRFGPGVRRAAVEEPMRVTSQSDGKVTLEPGPIRLEYDPKSFMPQGAAWLTSGAGGQESQSRITLNCIADGVWLVDDRGRDHLASEGEA
ncbi:MAG: hypothetical protein ABIP48_04970, partial [Planctomycetota bacterium]